MQQKMILCVDGGLVPMLSWATVLNREDFVVMAASGEDGESTRILGTKPIDVVVLTTAVNNIDDLVRHMKALKPDVPVVLFLPTHDNGLKAVDKVVRNPNALRKTIEELI